MSNQTIDALLAPGMEVIFKPREVRILTLMAQGIPIKQMPETLNITAGTIKTYLCYLYEREHLINGFHAVAIFIKQQITRKLLYEAKQTKHIVFNPNTAGGTTVGNTNQFGGICN